MRLVGDEDVKMKINVLIVLSIFVIIAISIACFGAEVSEKQDIAIFGLTYYNYSIPSEILGYIDSSISNVFINLKRFNVLGYGNYRIEEKDIDEFIERIREIKAKEAYEAGTYDEKFGTVVIKGEDFEKIVNSFIVVIPTLSNYTPTVRRIEIETERGKSYIEQYNVELVIDITFIDVKRGVKAESIRISGSGTSTSFREANKEAIDSAISTLSYRIRQLESFKIRSIIIEKRGDRVIFQPGKNFGIKPGDEYEVLIKKELGRTGKIVEVPSGLIRVKKVFPEYSEGKLLIKKGDITEGDKLVEIAKLGITIGFTGGFMQVDIPDMNYSIILVDDLYRYTEGTVLESLSNYYYIKLNQKERNYAPVFTLDIQKSLGYRFKGILDISGVVNLPLFGILGEAGFGASFYKRRLSLTIQGEGGFLYMTTFRKPLYDYNLLFDTLLIGGEEIDYNKDPVASIYGTSVGLRGGVSLDFLFNHGFSLSFGANYRVYTPIKRWSILIEETSGSNPSSVTIESDSPNVLELPESEGMKMVRISGYELRCSLNLRF